MKILFDMDSILADIGTDWYAQYNETYGDNLDMDMVKTWNTHEYAKHGTAIYTILERKGFFRNLKPIPGALEAVQKVLDKGHTVKIVTAAEFPINYSEKVEWFKEKLPQLKKRDLYMMHEKHEIHADVLIDDGPHNAEAYRKAHPNAKILTIGYPYNENCTAYTLIAGSYKDPVAAWELILKEIG